MPRIARVVPEVSLDRAFDYSIPDSLSTEVTLGAKVRVPFKSREIVGYIVQLSEKPSDFKGALKPILEVLSKSAFLPAVLIELAQWMAQYYCAALTTSWMSVLPKAVRKADAAFKQRLWIEALTITLPEGAVDALKKSPAQRKAWDHLQQNGPGWLADLTEVAGTAVWRGLAERNLISIESRTQDRDPFLNAPVAESTPYASNAEQTAARGSASRRHRKRENRSLSPGHCGSPRPR
jgi:primosomal protein N' (replication factor Y)